MNAKDIRIVFMGTPEFAVPSLKALVEGGYNVVGVVTMPDKPAGRGMRLQESDVKRAAKELGIQTILQPEKLRDEAFLEALQALQPDLGIVIAFRMLPEVVWAMPRFGTFNLHASLLPEYRGAAPINWAIINGDKESGNTTFLLNHEIDKGAIIGQQRTPIGDEECVGDLYDRLMTMGAELVVESVEKIASGGEVSRVMLALKALLAEKSKLPTIIFDEIDTGVSGRIADAMGDIISRLGENMQVVAITHLPQVASKGEAHFVVYKQDSRTNISRLGEDDRITEIAKMLSGSEISAAALSQARILLGVEPKTTLF